MCCVIYFPKAPQMFTLNIWSSYVVRNMKNVSMRGLQTSSYSSRSSSSCVSSSLFAQIRFRFWLSGVVRAIWPAIIPEVIPRHIILLTYRLYIRFVIILSFCEHVCFEMSWSFWLYPFECILYHLVRRPIVQRARNSIQFDAIYSIRFRLARSSCMRLDRMNIQLNRINWTVDMFWVLEPGTRPLPLM